MINLLAPEEQRQLAAARTNSLLLRYTILLGIIILLLVTEIGGAYLVLESARATNETAIHDNERATASYSQVRQQALTFNNDLSTAKYILGQQVPYTKIILAIAASLPPGAVLDKISLDPATFGTPTILTIRTTSYAKSIEIKNSLQQSSVFSDVSLQTVGQGSDGQYPVTASYNVTYSKGLLNQ